MKFKYKARTKDGELQVGFVEAVSRDAGLNILASNSLYILSIDEAEKKDWQSAFSTIFSRVGAKDLMVFTRQFATLLGAQVSMSDALRTLARQTGNPFLKEATVEIKEDIDSGLSLSQAMEKQSDIFSLFYINMIRSAEITGRVEGVMNFLADYMEKQYLLTSKVRNALIYPSMMIILFFVVAAIMGAVVLPQIGSVFKELGVNLPWFTELLIVGGGFLALWWWAILLAFSVFGIFIVDYFKTEEGRVVFDELVLRIPVFDKLLKELYVARFAESLSVLIKGGIPIVQAIEVTGHTVGSLIYKEILHQAAEDVRRGELLSQSLAKHEDYFPPLVGQMVAIGEATGRLEELLEKVAGFYGHEVDDLVSNLVEMIQPALMVVVGLLVGALFASILLPIYSLVSTF
ncbi:MAG: type II secretion system F family protein [Candidatus Colwellbacteria bacterium]|nr:type II secretion system F family protein [Candidatus Colwellbacteria bacterium]